MEISNQKIFITGGTGFIGSNICRELLTHNKITIFDNGRRNALSFFKLESHPNLKVVKGDVLDFDSLASAMRGSNIIIHLAAIAGVNSYFNNPFKTMEVNFIGTYNVLKASKQNLSTTVMINFSTSEVYGPKALDVGEDTNTMQCPIGDLRWTYSTSKLAAEHLCFAFAKENGLPVTSIRPFNIYGPGQVGEGAIQTMILRALKNEDIEITGDGKQTRSWCYVTDATDAVKLVVKKEEAVGKVFNVGNPSTLISILDLAKHIIKHTSSNSKIIFKEYKGQDVLQRNPNIDKAKKILGFKPKIGLDEGISKSANWYKECFP